MELKEDKNILGVLVETFFTGEITDEYIDLVKDSAMYKAFKNIEENSGMILPCSVPLNGEYNQKDIYASVLCYVDSNGAKPLKNIKLQEEELRAFCDSCNIIRRYFFERQDL